MSEKIEFVKAKLTTELQKYLCADEIDSIHKAIKTAEQAHHGQFRASGNPYICHPLEVALILAQLEQDSETVIAGILHDTLEDSDITVDTLNAQFGPQITSLVEGVTKIGKLQFNSNEELQTNNYRRMLLAMANDIRVIIIKLADRLHNMKTLKYLSKEKQMRIAVETQEIYAPLAHRLGIANLKWELEDLSFYYTNYEEFQSIKKLVDMKRSEREGFINEFIKKIETIIQGYQITATIEGRPKHFFSIYRKMKKSGLNFEALYDTLGIRIIVDEVQDCYTILGGIHAQFVPINGRFKDYIALPKSNMYQSLHTTLIGTNGKPIEIQIRTPKMHQIAEYGVAAHWNYKDQSVKSKIDTEFAWLQKFIKEDKQSVKPKEFLKNLKSELFIDEIFVFTPSGDVLFMVKGAVPLDFAYRIHSEVGNHYLGAKVNGKIVPIHYRLKSGDQVEILTSKKSSPKIDWIQWVKTRHATNKIKQWIKSQKRDALITQAKNKVTQFCIAENIPVEQIETVFDHDKVKQKYNVRDKDELYILIAEGEYAVKSIIGYIKKVIFKESPPSKRYQTKTYTTSKRGTSNGVIVMGDKQIKTTMAKCCLPLPGDQIIGIIVPEKGVSVHRDSCTNISSLSKEKQDRLIPIEWDIQSEKETYTVALNIEAFDRIGLLQDILSIISEKNVNMIDLKTMITKDKNKVKSKIIIQVNHTSQINDIKHSLLLHPDVIYVGRS